MAEDGPVGYDFRPGLLIIFDYCEDVQIHDVYLTDSPEWTVARWRNAYQNDFAARMQWCILPYSHTNHNPIAIVGGDDTNVVLFKNHY
jgi:hypothetical protein